MTIGNIDQGQRKFERIPAKVNVTLHFPAAQRPHNQPLPEALTRNIAERGICICTETLFETGTVLHVQIDLEGWQAYLRAVLSRSEGSPDIHPLTAVGEVIWCHEQSGGKGYEVGVEFTEIDQQHFTAFQQYLHIIRETVR